MKYLLHYYSANKEFKLEFTSIEGLTASLMAIMPDVEADIAYIVYIGTFKNEA